MSLFGKILILLNSIVAGIFFVLVGVDWAKRQSWADNYIQHEVMITGLPLNDKETDARGQPRVDSIRMPLLKQMFQKSGSGTVVTTQLEELKDVKKRIQAKIDGKQTAKEKALQQIIILGVLADTQAQRELLAAQAVEVAKADAAEPETDKLQLQIDNAFARAEGAAGGQMTAEQQKQAIADLLFRLCAVLRNDEAAEGQPAPGVLESKAYERFLVVVGVSEGAAALDHTSQALRQFTADLRDSIDRERERFAADYKLRLERIAALSAELRELEDFLTRQKTLQADKATQVTAREKLRDDLTKQLNQERDKTATMLKEQKAVEDALFKNRQELRDAFQENQKLEQTLKALEKSR